MTDLARIAYHPTVRDTQHKNDSHSTRLLKG